MPLYCKVAKNGRGYISKAIARKELKLQKNEILPPDYGIYKFSRKFEEVMCPAPVESNRRKPAALQKSSDAAQPADSSAQNWW